jgi:type I restriction enzyme M protein
MSLSVNINEKANFIWTIPFTRYFYKYEPPRPSAEIKKEILAIEKELEGALAEVFDPQSRKP